MRDLLSSLLVTMCGNAPFLCSKVKMKQASGVLAWPFQHRKLFITRLCTVYVSQQLCSHEHFLRLEVECSLCFCCLIAVVAMFAAEKHTAL